MEWNVYYYNFNRDKIDTYNVLNHYSFFEDVKKAAKKYKTKEEFVEQLKKEVRYYFWSRAEYELIIEVTKDNDIFLIPWCGCKEPNKVKIDVTNDTSYDWKGFAEKYIKKQIYDNEAKIDIFDQLEYVWDDFSSYVWKNRKELLKVNYD